MMDRGLQVVIVLHLVGCGVVQGFHHAWSYPKLSRTCVTPPTRTRTSMSAPAVEGPAVSVDTTNIAVRPSVNATAAAAAAATDYSGLPEPPGPFAWPGVGNMLSMFRHGAQGKYDVVLRRRYGDIVRAQLLGSRWVFLFDPDHCREVLMAGKGKEFTDRQLAARYRSLEADTVVDVCDDMKSLALDAISQASYSLPLGLVGGQRRDTHADGARMGRLIRGENRYLNRAGQFLIPNVHKVGLNPAYRKLERIWAELEVIENRIIDDRRKKRAAAARANGGESERLSARDLLDVCLEAIEGGDESSEDLTDDIIRQNVHSVFFGGSDTTATTIPATLFEITKRKDVHARVVAELQSLDLDDPSMFSPSTMPQRFPFLDVCIKVAVRLYPILPSYNRLAKEDTSIQGYRVKRGTVVAASMYAIQRRKDIWGHDAESFRPERWLGELEGGVPKGVPASAYMPFGVGPRGCLGGRFALMETMVVVSVLLKSVAMRAVSGDAELEVAYPGQLCFPKGVPIVLA